MQDRWSREERLTYVRGGRERARKCAAMRSFGLETASLLGPGPFSKPQELPVICGLCKVSGISFL